MKRFLVGDTMQVIWINSGTVPSIPNLSIFSGSETLVASQSMVSSGNGHLYAFYTVGDSPGYFIAQTLVSVGGLPFKRRVKFRATTYEVD